MQLLFSSSLIIRRVLVIKMSHVFIQFSLLFSEAYLIFHSLFHLWNLAPHFLSSYFIFHLNPRALSREPVRKYGVWAAVLALKTKTSTPVFSPLTPTRDGVAVCGATEETPDWRSALRPAVVRQVWEQPEPYLCAATRSLMIYWHRSTEQIWARITGSKAAVQRRV